MKRHKWGAIQRRHRSIGRLPTAVALAALLVMASVATAAATSRSIHVLLDVRAVWSRTLSACVTEGVFFGFHTGSARYVDQGADVVVNDDVAGVWWFQTDTCVPSNSFFVAGDVPLESSDFFIDRQLGSAWIDVEVPVIRGSDTHVFAFDLAYAATGEPTVNITRDDDAGLIRQDRLSGVVITGTMSSTIPGGLDGFDLVWADIGSLTQVHSSG